MHTVIRTEELPAKQRFEFWWEAIANSMMPMEVCSERQADFEAELRSLDLGSVLLSRARSTPFEARRTPQMISRSDPGVVHLSLGVRTVSGIEQADRAVEIGPADIVIYDTTRPFHARARARRSNSSLPPRSLTDGIILQFYPDQLLLPKAGVEQILMRRISGRDGMGALLSGVLRRTMAQAGQFRPSDVGRLSSLIIELVSAVITRELDTEAATSSQYRTALFLQIKLFIERQVSDTDLSPAFIAAAHQMSTRSLHQLFGRNGVTVAGWIRHRRLERCRRELANPHCDHLTVSTIAGRYGFTSDSHFNRAFRVAYGVPPATYRREFQARREG